jgi:hypothetical protein
LEGANSGTALRCFPILTRHLGFRYISISDALLGRAATIDVQMTSLPISVPGSEFNEFLFAPIGEDKNGMLVSVLSGLARSDVDPWQEAAKLAQLPGETATKELAALIGALPDRAASYPDPRTIATRLIALLPRPLGSNGGPQQTPHSAGAVLKSYPWWVYVGFMCFVLGSQFMIASHQMPTKPGNVEVKDASTAFRPAPPLNSGQ